jgi:hypothetical protein
LPRNFRSTHPRTPTRGGPLSRVPYFRYPASPPPAPCHPGRTPWRLFHCGTYTVMLDVSRGDCAVPSDIGTSRCLGARSNICSRSRTSPDLMTVGFSKFIACDWTMQSLRPTLMIRFLMCHGLSDHRPYTSKIDTTCKLQPARLTTVSLSPLLGCVYRCNTNTSATARVMIPRATPKVATGDGPFLDIIQCNFIFI